MKKKLTLLCLAVALVIPAAAFSIPPEDDCGCAALYHNQRWQCRLLNYDEEWRQCLQQADDDYQYCHTNCIEG